MNTHSTQNPFDALATSYVVADLPGYACIELKGPDAKSFLHRLSTNMVDDLKPGESSLNVLANPKGRMVALLHQLIVADDRVLIVGGQDQAPALMAWLDQYLFVEQVELCDLSAQSAIALVIGAKAQDALEALAPSPERFVMRSFDYVDASQNPVPAYLVCGSPLARAPHIDADTLETLRIGAGIPWFPNEVNEAFNPLELGLTQAIHWAKGCYTGQEVISRLDTYSKLNKKLCRLKATKADFSELEAGQSVLHSGKSVGTLSSLAPQYWPGHACALGVFKFAPDADLSQPLAVQTSNRLVHLDLFQ